MRMHELTVVCGLNCRRMHQPGPVAMHRHVSVAGGLRVGAGQENA